MEIHELIEVFFNVLHEEQEATSKKDPDYYVILDTIRNIGERLRTSYLRLIDQKTDELIAELTEKKGESNDLSNQADLS